MIPNQVQRRVQDLRLRTELLSLLIFVFFIVLAGNAYAQESKPEGKNLWEVTENNTFVEVEGVPQYKIGVDDVLEVDLLVGTTVEKFTPVVRPNGFIVLPVLDIKVAGLTTNQAEEKIKEELSKYVIVPRLEVRVKEYKSKRVVLMGAVAISTMRVSGPGIYYLKGRTSVLEMVTYAGGTLPSASLDNVQIRRPDGTVLFVNFFKILAEGNIKENVILDAGDEVYIPSSEVAENKVVVFGEVKKPGIYPKKSGMTLIDAVASADGYTKYAVLSDTAIIRAGNPNSQIIVANLGDILKKGDLTQNITLMNNDIVYVPKSAIGSWNDFIEKLTPSLQLILLPLTGMVEIKYLSK